MSSSSASSRPAALLQRRVVFDEPLRHGRRLGGAVDHPGVELGREVRAVAMARITTGTPTPATKHRNSLR